MATKHPIAEPAIADPAGEEWQAAADAAWQEAERRAEKDGRHPVDHFRGYHDRKRKRDVPGLAPAMPDFAGTATEAVKLEEVLGRFVFQDGAVHDVTRATAACRLGPLRRGGSRQFVHFAAELKEALPPGAKRHDACMAAG